MVAKKPKGAGKDLPFDRIVYQIIETKVGSGFEAVCPELVMTGFGDTAEDAKKALRRQVAEYLEDCEKMNILDDTLIEAGFYFIGELWMSNEVEPAGDPKVRFIGTPSEADFGEEPE